VLDGELVILDADGRPQFERLSRRSRLKRRISIEHGARTDPACFFAFDMLELEGEDLRPRSLFNRKALLKDTIAAAKRVRYTDHVDVAGVRLFQLAEGLGLEGIVAKCADVPYPRGRARDWVKIKTAAGRVVDKEGRSGMSGEH
jgi:ATP-dependent DNA ligase